MLPTIVSRCQIVEFRPLGDAEVSAYLVDRHHVEPVSAEALARLSLGSVERAARLAEDAAGPGLREQYLKYAAQIVAGARPPDGPEPAAAFLGLLAAQQARIGEEVQEGARPAARRSWSSSSRTRRT